MNTHIKVITKITTLFVLVVFFSLVLHYTVYKQFTSHYWGSPMISAKHDSYIEQKDKINTLFMGSSKILFHISPDGFDKEINKAVPGADVYSFNYGVPGMLPMESFTLYEKMLESGELDNLDFVLLELSEIGNPKPFNLHKRRLVYWLDWNSYMDTQKINYSSVKRPIIRLSNTITYSISYVENLMNIGFVWEVSNYLTKYQERGAPFTPEKWEDNRGFITLPNPDSATLERITPEVAKQKQLSMDYFAKAAEIPVQNKVLQEKALSLIEKSKAKGINLVFLLTVRSKHYQYEELIPIMEDLPAENKIIMCNANEVPHFFEMQNMFDANHLNGGGAALFTQELASRFNTILEKDKTQLSNN